jgi:hypothetical protein
MLFKIIGYALAYLVFSLLLGMAVGKLLKKGRGETGDEEE